MYSRLPRLKSGGMSSDGTPRPRRDSPTNRREPVRGPHWDGLGSESADVPDVEPVPGPASGATALTRTVRIEVPTAAPAPPRQERDAAATPTGPPSTALLRGGGARRAAPPSWGWRGQLHRWSGGTLSPMPSEAELRHRAALEAVRRPLDAARTIVFANPKGGAGKTPATLLAAATFGTVRGGYVVAWDNNETRGTLGLRGRTGARATTVWDLLAAVERFESAGASVGELAGYVRGQGEAQFDLLASDEDPSRMASIGREEFTRIQAVLARFYRILCVDTGNNVRAANWQAAMAAADQLVVCSTYALDHGYSASWMLDSLVAAGRADLVANAVTVLSGSSPRPDPAVRADLVEHFAARTRAVHEIPYDRALGAGEQIPYGELAPATREAWLQACAIMASGL